MPTPLMRSTVAILAACGLAACALAQEPALKGPAVTDRGVPGTGGEFSGGGEGKFRQREVPPRVFMEAVTKALGPDAPESLRLSEEKRAELREVFGEYRKQVEAYMAKHGGDMDRQTDRPRDARRPRGKDAAGDGAGKPTPEEMAERARTMREGMPRPTDTYTKVWTMLTDAQRAAVEARLEEWKHERAVKEGEEYVQRRMKKQEPVPGQPPELAKKGARPAATDRPQTDRPMPDGARDGAAGIPPQMRERFMRILARLSAEERQQLLERLEARMQERAGNPSRGDRARDSSGSDKPAPSMDDVALPKPDQP